MDPLLEYACKRVIELEGLLLVEVPETVWPAEVGMVLSQVEVAGELPAHHINIMWLERMPLSAIVVMTLWVKVNY